MTGLDRFEGKVVDHQGNKVALADIKSHKFVGLYFSAHWCPPCRGFTPVLAQAYNDIKTEHPNALEIIFVSSDQDQASWQGYFKDMPWKALAFGDSLKQALGSEFGVTGIPCLVILKNDGTLVTKEGRGHIQQHGVGAVEHWSK